MTRVSGAVLIREETLYEKSRSPGSRNTSAGWRCFNCFKGRRRGTDAHVLTGPLQVVRRCRLLKYTS
jgi:hypothetical protein